MIPSRLPSSPTTTTSRPTTLLRSLQRPNNGRTDDSMSISSFCGSSSMKKKRSRHHNHHRPHPLMSSTSNNHNRQCFDGTMGPASSSTVFDLSELSVVSQQVQDSISFPNIMWPSSPSSSYGFFENHGDEDDNADSSNDVHSSEIDDDDDDEDDYFTPRRKRHCRGLVRCARSSDLSSMMDLTSVLSAGEESCTINSPAHGMTERRGSAGSMM